MVGGKLLSEISNKVNSSGGSVRSRKTSEQIQVEKMLIKQKQKKKIDKRLKAFLEDEAELGSDNEENDDRRKDIN